MADSRQYVVVVFYSGIGHTLQENNKLGQFFTSHPKFYKNRENAVAKAKRLATRGDFSCIFAVSGDERISCDQYNMWMNDNSRMIFKSKIC